MSSTLQNLGQLTVSAWIKPDRSPATLPGQAILQKLKDNLGYTLLLGGRRSYWKAYGGGPGFEYLLTKFTLRLQEDGFSP